MSTALERRAAKLEQAARPAEKQVDLIVRRIISPAGAEVIRAKIGDTIVDRRDDETESAFVARSKGEALAATCRRPCRVLLLPAEVLQ
ncbi:hypothetical protein E4Q23_09005 [Candidatus Accumulibacter phosphatis]|uniref:Uncharacterized protein n=1 Tax=Candidatus Accumulibacter phosphatis TaxID=327160 RepID=A0ABX1TUD7_9PROT|nr:hypothetical protein [Candidatus Accumulibacter phosphatis]NMQ27884.1 hypothetical protein [Candidatus Accumulibacter phosphatis]